MGTRTNREGTVERKVTEGAGRMGGGGGGADG